MAGRPNRRTGSSWEALLECQKWSGVPLEGPVVVWSTFQRARSSREALLKGREWSVGPPGGPEVVGRSCQRVRRPSRRAGSI